MRLTFVKPHKSINSFPETDLPDFVILTGVNGAGKTHLVEAIENGSIQIDNLVHNPQTRPIRLFNWTNLVPKDSGAYAPYQVTQEKYGLWSEISQHIQASTPQLFNVLQQYNKSDIVKTNITKILRMTEEEFIKTGITPEEAKQIFQAIQNTGSDVNKNVVNRFTQNDPNRHRLVNLLTQKNHKDLIDLDEDEFYKNFPSSWIPGDMFQQSFSRLFAGYQSNLLNNQLKELAKSKGKSVTFLTDNQFIDKYGEPPWIFVNSILKTANLDFRINQPHEYEDRPYEPILTDQIRGTQVKFADLSSGEKILMSFALCLYYAEDRRQIIDYPKVLLFDEIDAPLHPSMTQSLLRTIEKVLINRHKIKVILTTHSPSTVALAPEESLYVMYKNNQRCLEKTTKDKALAILTTGVPTLSIDYDNRRQVFVESHYDVKFYEKIYKKLKNIENIKKQLIPEISLNFISSGGTESGNCDQVKKIVNTLYQNGNKTVYGIIDWDLKNNETERIKVLGYKNRYSIENYILEPLLLAALLIREKLIARDSLGMKENETYIDLARLENNKLQKIANFILNKIKSTSSVEDKDDNQSCEYVGGQKINLPSWLLNMKGHDLEKNIKETFKELNRYRKEGELKQEILSKVIDDIPALIPKDFLLLFQKIQNYDGKHY